jgi:hypothetical protein
VLYDSRSTCVFGIVASWEVYERDNNRPIEQRLIEDSLKLLYPSYISRDGRRKYNESKWRTVGLSRDDLGGRIAVHSLRRFRIMDYEFFDSFGGLHSDGWFSDMKQRRAVPNMLRSAISAKVDDS